jgi:HSP20 family molecular chaperone IbpA
MAYRRLTYHYAELRTDRTWAFDAVWQSAQRQFLRQARWRPDADVYETADRIEMIVDLAGVDDDDFEVQLFDNALVVEGIRRVPVAGEDATYHAAGIRQGLFRVELPVPARVDVERVEARYDRGLLRVTLPKVR